MGRLQFALAIAIAAMAGGAATAVAINMMGDMPTPTACSVPVPLAACPMTQQNPAAQQFFSGRQLPTSGGAPLMFKP
jgi:hypothetical protein